MPPPVHRFYRRGCWSNVRPTFLFATLRRNIGTNSPHFPLAATRDAVSLPSPYSTYDDPPPKKIPPPCEERKKGGAQFFPIYSSPLFSRGSSSSSFSFHPAIYQGLGAEGKGGGGGEKGGGDSGSHKSALGVCPDSGRRERKRIHPGIEDKKSILPVVKKDQKQKRDVRTGAILVPFFWRMSITLFLCRFFIFCCSCRIFFAPPLLSWWYFFDDVGIRHRHQKKYPFFCYRTPSNSQSLFYALLLLFSSDAKKFSSFPYFFLLQMEEKEEELFWEKRSSKRLLPLFCCCLPKAKKPPPLSLASRGRGRPWLHSDSPSFPSTIFSRLRRPRSGSLGRVPPPSPPPPLPPFFRLNTESREGGSPSRFCPPPLPLLF